MTRKQFGERFRKALEEAVTIADRRLGRPVPRRFEIILHGAGHAGDLLDPVEAANELYLSENYFYRIVDVSVVEIRDRVTRIFVRASGHRPGPLETTWNDPPGSGPFRQLPASQIRKVPG